MESPKKKVESPIIFKKYFEKLFVISMLYEDDIGYCFWVSFNAFDILITYHTIF